MNASIPQQIARLQAMTVGELQRTWIEVFGESSRSRNRTFLWKRLAWELQARVYGRLSQPALNQIRELAADRPPRFWPPQGATTEIERMASTSSPTSPERRRDPRLPGVGATLVRKYKGDNVRVLVLADGVEWAGRHFDSLSEVALAVTGSKWNGWLFFGLTDRKRAR